VRVEYGTVLAAGHVLRKDVLEGGQLVVPAAAPCGHVPLRHGLSLGGARGAQLRDLHRQLAALQVWYQQVRRPLLEQTPHGAACLAGALKQLAAVRKERLKRSTKWWRRSPRRTGRPWANRCARSTRRCARAGRRRGAAGGGGRRGRVRKRRRSSPPGTRRRKTHYVARVQGLPAEAKAAGTAWLQKIVDGAGSPA
jgi:hypothetical protein